ncbi:unannotated protein [freshwater metagenome]|uniref:Unannotated protein n=1 Tax=freshwater metagenome TaxID=449393 RepID=A0A6J7FRQ7_9ZZZZ
MSLEAAAPLQALPDPGEQVPTLSRPIVAIFTGALSVFALSTWVALAGTLPAPVTVLFSAAAIFVLFTVLHDAAHYSISTRRWVNVTFGRVAMLFVSPLISFKSFAFIHIEHHRNTNDDANDPDHFVSGSPLWQVPVRFALMDAPYLGFLARNVRRRPRAEVLETSALLVGSIAVIAACALTGHLWTLALVYLIPARVAMFVLAWWFDWLPHHDLEDTQQENRYRATRNRVGSEWILTPLLLSQNYHLVHHLHPSIPFHRYVAAWKRNEEAYLERDAAIGTVFGRQLDVDEYREWKRLNGKLARLLPLRTPAPGASRTAVHDLRVAETRRLTADSVLVRFEVPEQVREQFVFQAGQHVTVRADIDGERVQRSYSICSAAGAGSGILEIAVRHVPGGVFSTFVLEQLQAGDMLEVSAPTGTFGVPVDPTATRTYVALAAGSGITPVLSLLRTTLAAEPGSTFTLLYGNRDADSTMFREELEQLQAQHGDRLRVLHVRSRDPQHPAHLRGRLDAALLTRLLDAQDLAAADHWFLCGPVEMAVDLRDALVEHGVNTDRVHVELFQGRRSAGPAAGSAAATVSVTLRGRQHDVPLAAGDTVLEAALKAGLDAPYACLGGACGTCTAKVVLGKVAMEQNFALNTAAVDRGQVLTCQSRPTTPTVAVDYDDTTGSTTP